MTLGERLARLRGAVNEDVAATSVEDGLRRTTALFERRRRRRHVVQAAGVIFASSLTVAGLLALPDERREETVTADGDAVTSSGRPTTDPFGIDSTTNSSQSATTTSSMSTTTTTTVAATVPPFPLREVDWTAVAYPVDCGAEQTGTPLAYPEPEPGVDLAVVAVTCVVGAGSPPSAVVVFDRADGRASAHALQTIVTYQDNWVVTSTDTATAIGPDLRITVHGYSSEDIPRCCPDIQTELTWTWGAGTYQPSADQPARTTLPPEG